MGVITSRKDVKNRFIRVPGFIKESEFNPGHNCMTLCVPLKITTEERAALKNFIYDLRTAEELSVLYTK